MNKTVVSTILLSLIVIGILAVSVRGILGNPTISNLHDKYWADDGPLELSPDRGRFALLYSMVEEKAVHFSVDVARFATPDVGYHKGQYVSLFAPGLSFLIIPGYLLGKILGASQVGAYAVISVFAVLNTCLIYLIARLIRASHWAAWLGALTFIFATPAFAYAVSLYQHHVSIFLFLLSLYCLIRWKGYWASLVVVWFCVACAVVVDYPNAVLFTPIILYALYWIVAVIPKKDAFALRINPPAFISPIGIILPLLFFMWFNQASYGNPWQLAGTVPAVKAIDDQGQPAAARSVDPSQEGKEAVNFFQTRNLLNGFIIHSISLDRGTIIFAPVVLLGLFGIFFCYTNFPQVASVLLGTIGANILLYSMWGDPWGGWAFGSRYLIVSYALLSIFIALGLTAWKKNFVVAFVFFVLFSYSAAINTLGALSTNTNPPQVEVLALEKLSGVPQPYTYEHNYQYITSNHSKSFVWQTFASSYLSAWQYYQIIAGIIIAVGFAGTVLFVIYDRD